MSKIAIIKTGGKQYKVKEGQRLKIEKLPLAKGKTVKFETLLIASPNGKELNLGQPILTKKVEGRMVERGREKKVSVVKYKNKTRYLRRQGHRQAFSLVEVTKIPNSV